MPRQRTLSDADVLDGLERVLLERGPHDFTLADVARATGLAPATLLQRFGTKQGLLRAFAERSAASAASAFDVTAPGLGSLRKTLGGFASKVGDRRSMANGLALLLEDIRDPALGASARAHADAMEQAIERHLRAAVAARELRTDDPHALARTVHTAYNGALILWAIRGKGTATRAVLEAVDAVLAPYVRGSRRSGYAADR